MSAETTGIPLVVRYNSRGQPDGLKEELNINVNSVSATTYKNLPVSALSGLSDVQITSTPTDSHVLTWKQPDPNEPGSWMPVAPGTGPGGVSQFPDLLDVNSYPPSNPGGRMLHLVDNQAAPYPIRVNYSTRTITEIEGLYTLFYPAVTPSPTRIIAVGGTSLPYTFISLTDTPPSYSGYNDRFVAVDSNSTGLTFSNITAGTITSIESDIINLQTDVGALQGSVGALQTTVANLDLTAIKIAGVTLTGTPTTTNSIIKYNGTNFGFAPDNTGSVGSTSFIGLSDTPGTTWDSNDQNKLLVVNSAGSAVSFASATIQTVDTAISQASTLNGYFTGLADNQILTYSNASNGVTSIDYSLTTIGGQQITSPILNYQVLGYLGSDWKNLTIDGLIASPPGGDGDFALHTSGLNSSGLTQGDLLVVGPSGTVISQSSLLPSINPVPLFEDIGKIIIINESATDLIESSALKWDYTSQGLQVLGDVSAQNYYGNITGATGEISNISGVSSILFVTSMPPEYSAVEGEVYYDTDAHTLSIQTSTDTTLQVGQEQVIRVRNGTNTTINNGEVVYLSGVQGTGAAKLLVGKASASTSEEIQDIIGIATQTIVSGHDGFITTFGIVNDVDTAAYPVGTVLYLSTSAGLYTSAAPPAPNHSVRLGIVLRQSSTAGSIFAHIDPGYDIADLHDVSVQGVQTGDLLRWNGTIFAPSAYDHGTLAGLADNDHPQYVLSSTNQVLSSLVGNIETSTINLSGYIAANEPSWLSVATEHNTLLGLDNNEAHPQYVLSATNQALSSLVTSIESSAIDLSAYIAANEATWSTDTDTTDHGSLTGRSDDDHTQYIIKTNTTQARNTIQPNADVPALTLQAGLSNTGRLFDIKDSTTQTVAYITIDGTIVTDGGLTVGGTKSFLIDHPTKEAMKLQYSCLEGPENGVYVRGRVTSQVIDLPDYWVGLVHENSITVTLTPVGSAQSDLYVSNIADNKVHLARESNQPIDCFYIVNATRKDLENLLVEFPK